MKLTIKIEKKHLIVLIIFLVVLFVGISFAGLTDWTNAGKPQSHTTIWTTEIRGKDVATINVRDDLTFDTGKTLRVNGNIIFNGQKSCKCLGYGASLNYVNTVFVPGTFTKEQCSSFCVSESTGYYELGCMFYDSYSRGTVRAVGTYTVPYLPPINCGWN